MVGESPEWERKDKLKIAYEYLEVTGVKLLFEKQMNEILFKVACETPPEGADAMKQFKEIFTWDNIAPILAETLADNLPEKIMQDVTEFYKTESGKYLSSHLIKLTEALQANITTFLQNTLSEIE